MNKKITRTIAVTALTLSSAIAASASFADGQVRGGISSVKYVSSVLVEKSKYADYKWKNADVKAVPSNNWQVTKTAPNDMTAANENAKSNDATPSRFRWGIRNDADQARFRWGIRNDAVQARFRWGIRNDADQARFRWGIRNDADQARFRWGIRNDADQARFRWGIRNDAEQARFRWGIR